MRIRYCMLSTLAVVSLGLVGCSGLPKPVRGECVNEGRASPACFSTRSSDYEAGPVFCSERYQHGHTAKTLSPRARQLAGKGYLYALAAAKILHQENEEGRDHRFGDSELLKHNAEYDKSSWHGFQGAVYERRSPDGREIEKVVVTFAGSNQWRDWFIQNIGIPVQYASARELVLEVSEDPKYKGVPIVAAGYSLGGGLAVHVKKHPATASRVQEAWLFNPSPFDGILGGDPVENVYVLFQDNEILLNIRNALGANYALEQNKAEYGTIDSSKIYGHYRYSLMLQLLHAADVNYWCETRGDPQPSDALQVLRKSNMRACESELDQTNARRAAARAAKKIAEWTDPFAHCTQD